MRMHRMMLRGRLMVLVVRGRRHAVHAGRHRRHARRHTRQGRRRQVRLAAQRMPGQRMMAQFHRVVLQVGTGMNKRGRRCDIKNPKHSGHKVARVFHDDILPLFFISISLIIYPNLLTLFLDLKNRFSRSLLPVLEVAGRGRFHFWRISILGDEIH